MAKNVTLPEAAKEHMPEQAIDKLNNTPAGDVLGTNPPPSGPFVLESTTASETLVGHEGQVDYFVFDLRQAIGADVISGYETEFDTVIFEYDSEQTPAVKITAGTDDATMLLAAGTVTILANHDIDYQYVFGDFFV
jgi:hypothetical protein